MGGLLRKWINITWKGGDVGCWCNVLFIHFMAHQLRGPLASFFEVKS